MLDLTQREEAAVKAKDIAGMYEVLDTAVMLETEAIYTQSGGYTSTV